MTFPPHGARFDAADFAIVPDANREIWCNSRARGPLHNPAVCWRACGRRRCSGSRPARCRWRSMSRSVCRLSTWSACPTRRCARAAIAIRSAIRNSGFEFPPHRITVNLAPADVRKAVRHSTCRSRSACSRRLERSRGATSTTSLLIGELSLDGGIQPARGVLPVAAAARRDNVRALLLPWLESCRSGGRAWPVSVRRPFARRSGVGA